MRTIMWMSEGNVRLEDSLIISSSDLHVLRVRDVELNLQVVVFTIEEEIYSRDG